MSIYYRMENRSKHESSDATRPSSNKMLKKNTQFRCAGFILMNAYSMLAVGIIILSAACASQAMPMSSMKRTGEPESTLIAFPRVGRSVPDNEYYLSDDQVAQGSNTNLNRASDEPSVVETPHRHFGLKTRTKRQALIPFPRTGKRASALIPFPRTGKKRAALMAYPRTGRRYLVDGGKRASLLPFPRSGKRSTVHITHPLNHVSDYVPTDSKEFQTNAIFSSDVDIPSSVNEYNDDDRHRILQLHLSREYGKNGINTEQDTSPWASNSGLFGLNSEELGKRVDDELREFYNGIRILRF